MADLKPDMTVLEVGCASGVATEIAAKSLIQPGSMLVACDFSKIMVDLMCERFYHSDFTKLHKFIPDRTDYTSCNSSILDFSKIDRAGKVVLGC